MAAHKVLQSAEEDLGKLIKSVDRLLVRHKNHFSDELVIIKSVLVELQPVVKSLKERIDSFKFHLSIKEVGDFHKKLEGYMELCENVSREPKSQASRYTTQIDEFNKSIKEQLLILTGKKSNSDEETGLLGGVKGLVETLIHHGPEENGVKARFKDICGQVLQPLIHPNQHEKHSAKELFEHLYGCVQTLISNKVNFKRELGSTKSRLDELKPLQVKYIEVIEDCNESCHFSIKEVDDYKEELSKAIKLCEDFSRENNSQQKSASGDKILQLNRDLKKQFENMTAKKRKGGLFAFCR